MDPIVDTRARGILRAPRGNDQRLRSYGRLRGRLVRILHRLRSGGRRRVQRNNNAIKQFVLQRLKGEDWLGANRDERIKTLVDTYTRKDQPITARQVTQITDAIDAWQKENQASESKTYGQFLAAVRQRSPENSEIRAKAQSLAAAEKNSRQSSAQVPSLATAWENSRQSSAIRQQAPSRGVKKTSAKDQPSTAWKDISAKDEPKGAKEAIESVLRWQAERLGRNAGK